MSDEIPAEATVHTIHAGPEADGERVDRFLAGALPSLSRSRVKGLIEEGRASRDGVRLREPAEPVRAGCVYALSIPAPVAATPQAQDIAFPILYEDSDLLVIDKPAGLVVHPAPGNLDGTLVNALLAHCGEDLPGIGGEKRPGIVHRLDKDTSGVMVVAKTEQALAALSAAFAARDLDRAYLALVWGQPNPATGAIEGDIGRDPRDRKRMAIVTRGGKPALTHYRTLAQRDLAVALLECRLATGRTHQIRVHLASRGHPLVGDPLYGPGGLPRPGLTALPGDGGYFLHAERLAFRHPVGGRDVVVVCPPPEELRAGSGILTLS